MIRWTICMVAVALVGLSHGSAEAGATTKRATKARWHSVDPSGPDYGAPTSTVWRTLKSTDNAPGLTIERIAGCHGKRGNARTRVEGNSGVLKEPVFNGGTFEPGVLAVDSLGAAGCVLYDEPTGVVPFNQSVMSWQTYMEYMVFDCGCGDCFDPKTEEAFDPEELESRATETHRAEYKKYNATKTVEVANNRETYAAYAANHRAWMSGREAKLPGAAVRVTLTASADMKPGRLSVYNYHLIEHQFCGETNFLERQNMTDWRLDHPKLAKGQVFEVWLDGVDVTKTWGFTFAEDDAALDQRFEKFSSDSERSAADGQPPFQALPDLFKGTAAETEPGISSDTLDECCSC